MSDSQPDLRSNERLPHASRVLHRELVLSGAPKDYAEGALLDISENGLSFQSSRSYAKDDVLELRLLLYGWERHKNEFYTGDLRKSTDPMVVIAVVASCEDNASGKRIGVRFDNVDPSHHDALRAYLKMQADGRL